MAGWEQLGFWTARKCKRPLKLWIKHNMPKVIFKRWHWNYQLLIPPWDFWISNKLRYTEPLPEKTSLFQVGCRCRTPLPTHSQGLLHSQSTGKVAEQTGVQGTIFVTIYQILFRLQPSTSGYQSEKLTACLYMPSTYKLHSGGWIPSCWNSLLSFQAQQLRRQRKGWKAGTCQGTTQKRQNK